MKRVLLLLLFFWAPQVMYSQPNKGLSNGAAANGQEAFTGNTYAVIVGIDTYQHHKQNKLEVLHHAADDARAFKAFLRSEAGGNVPEQNIKMFINGQAFSGEFKMKGIRWININAQKGDRVYLYFSGHGLTVNGDDSYFMAFDAPDQIAKEMMDQSGSQPFDHLKKHTIKPLCEKGVQVIFIADACRTDIEKDATEKTMGFFNPSVEMRVGDMMLLSSSNGQPSQEIDGQIKHGIFTYYLLKGFYGLADDNGDGMVSFDELNTYLTKMVKAYTRNQQKPTVNYGGSDDPLLAKVDEKLLTAAKQDLVVGAAGQPLAFAGKGLKKNYDHTPAYIAYTKILETGKIWGKDGALQAFSMLEKATRNDTAFLQNASLGLLALLADTGQAIVNAYVAADPRYFKNQGEKYDYVFSKGAIVYDTLYKISRKYFNDSVENAHYLQQALFMKGRSLSNTENSIHRDSAFVYLNKAYNMDTSDVYILQALDLVLEEKKMYTLARQNQRRVIAKYPKWSFAYNLMGTLCGVFDDSVDILKSNSNYIQAYELNKSYAAPYTNIATNFKNGLHQYDSAEFYYKKSLQVDSFYGLAWCNLGVLYQFDLKQPFLAEQCFRNAMTYEPQYIQSYRHMGHLYQSLDHLDSAKAYFQRALNLAHGATDYGNMVEIYLLNNEYEKAEENCKKAISIDSTNVDVLTRLAAIYNKYYEYIKAEKLYIKASQVDSNNKYVWDNLANSLYNQKRYSESEMYLKKSIFIDSNNAYPWNLKGLISEKENNDAKAIQFYKKAVLIDSNDFYPINNLGKVFEKQTKYDSAKRYYQRAILLRPEFAYEMDEIEKHIYEEFVYARADKFHNQIRAIDSTYDNIWYNLGALNKHSYESDKSFEYFERSIKLDSVYLNAFHFSDKKRYEALYKEAQLDYIKDTAVDTTYTYKWFDLGYKFAEREQYDLAQKYYRKAINIDSNYTDAWGFLGKSFELQHKYDSAESCYKREIAIDPTTYNWRDLAFAYKKQGKYTDAEALFKKIINMDSTSTTSYTDVGDFYQYNKNYSLAEYNFKRAIKLAPKDYSLYYYLVRLYAVQSDFVNTEKSLKLFVKSKYASFASLRADQDLDAVINVPAFKALLKKYFPKEYKEE